MRGAGHACGVGHLRNKQGAGDAAHIHHIGLHDVDRADVDHPLPGGKVPVLLAPRDIQIQRGGHLCRGLQIPIGDRFLEVADAVILQEMPHLDGAGHGKAGVAVDQLCNAVTQNP